MSNAIDLADAVLPPIFNGVSTAKQNSAATNNIQTGINSASTTMGQNGLNLAQLHQQSIDSLSPYTAGGPANVDMLNKGLAPGGGLADPYGKTFSFTGEDLQNSPGYQFNLEQGQNAIDAARRAMGTRFSGGAVKKAIEYGTDYAGTKFNDAFGQAKSTFDTNSNQFETDQANRYNRLNAAANFGLDATKATVDENQKYGTANTANSEDMANLQIQLAQAKANGNIAQANNITNTIKTLGGAVPGIVKTLFGGGSPATPGVTGQGVAGNETYGPPNLPGPGEFNPQGGLGSAAYGPPDLGSEGNGLSLSNASGLTPDISKAGEGVGAVTGVSGAVGGGGTLTGYAGGGLVTSHGALVGMMTNPITIGVAAGIIGITALLKSQAHWEANDFTKNVQTKFGDGLVQSVDAFNAAAQSGQMTQEQGQQAAQAIQQALAGFEQARQKFSARGGQHTTVANQAKAEMDKDFGPDFSSLIAGLNSTVAGLPAGA
jgi:hypothetical protein